MVFANGPIPVSSRLLTPREVKPLDANPETGYATAHRSLRPKQMIQIFKASAFPILPSAPGVYIFWDDYRVYCGASLNLRDRIPDSRSEQRFGHSVLTFRGCEAYDPGWDWAGWLDLEACCIGALNTIIYGNALPLELVNQNHVKTLPYSVWTTSEYTLDHLAIEIAQAALYAMGLPPPLTHLPPYRNLFFSWLPKLQDHLSREWPTILAKERQRRLAAGGAPVG